LFDIVLILFDYCLKLIIIDFLKIVLNGSKNFFWNFFYCT